MLKIDEKAAAREQLARTTSLKNLSATENYSTGARVPTADAAEYVGYFTLAAGAQRMAPAVELLRIEEITPGPAGTGSAAEPLQDPDWAAAHSLPCGTGGRSALVHALDAVRSAAGPVTPAEIVKTVRSVFVLKITEAAAVFAVSRPTIYEWERQSEMEAIRAARDRERAKTLFRIARDWAARPPISGRWLNATLRAGTSMFDLLRSDPLDEEAIRRAYDELKAAEGELIAAEQERSRRAASGLAKAFGAMGGSAQAKRGESAEPV